MGKIFFGFAQLQVRARYITYTDASKVGFGGFLGTHWFVSTWPKPWLDLHISVRELYPIVLAVELWANEMQNKYIEFHCDNLAVVFAINKQTAKDQFLMKLIRRLVIQALRSNIVFKAKHIPGLQNTIADKLSRLQMAEFRRIAPYMDKECTEISHLVNNPRVKYQRIFYTELYQHLLLSATRKLSTIFKCIFSNSTGITSNIGTHYVIFSILLIQGVGIQYYNHICFNTKLCSQIIRI